MELLLETAKIIADYKSNHPDIQKTYNIFDVLEISHKEVLMCRMLADFLNPDGKHHNGTKYLHIFLSEVLHIENISEEELNQFRVYKEYLIDENRRIDIVICSRERFIPIEVKINAKDQTSQCYSYYQYALSQYKKAKVYYLTKSGTPPSKSSTSIKVNGITQEMPADKIVCISFQNDIRYWLQKILEVETGTMKIIIEQYLDTVNQYTCQLGSEVHMEIAAKISSSEEYLRTGIEIVSSIDTAKANVIRLVMEEFEHQMEPLLDQYNLEKENKFHWYEYQDCATEEFYKKYSTYPGLNYRVKSAFLTDNIEMWLRIEVEHNLFAGYCLFECEKISSTQSSGKQYDVMDEHIKNKVKKYLNLSEINNDNWWITWKYLPIGSDNWKIDSEKIPDFKSMNEAALQLADSNKRVKFVNECIQVIISNLLQLQK